MGVLPSDNFRAVSKSSGALFPPLSFLTRRLGGRRLKRQVRRSRKASCRLKE